MVCNRICDNSSNQYLLWCTCYIQYFSYCRQVYDSNGYGGNRLEYQFKEINTKRLQADISGNLLLGCSGWCFLVSSNLNENLVVVMDIKNLKSNCEECFGLCCVALYFSASEGFPVNKEAGEPCPNLSNDFRCLVHEELWTRGLKGCVAYDCFGAGQKVSRNKEQKNSKLMFKTFQIMRQLHELLWYLTEAISFDKVEPIHDDLVAMLDKIENISLLDSLSLTGMDHEEDFADASELLTRASELIRNDKGSFKPKKTLGRRADLIGVDLRKINLQGASLRGAYLIAADLRNCDLDRTDFLGADFRDADIRGADLSHSIFLTQAQINSARGDLETKLPVSLQVPSHWFVK